MKKTASKLDWNRMLGFEQITEARNSTTGMEPLGPKIGSKVGGKVGNKIGLKAGLKIGAKQGLKA